MFSGCNRCFILTAVLKINAVQGKSAMTAVNDKLPEHVTHFI